MTAQTRVEAMEVVKLWMDFEGKTDTVLQMVRFWSLRRKGQHCFLPTSAVLGGDEVFSLEYEVCVA